MHFLGKTSYRHGILAEDRSVFCFWERRRDKEGRGIYLRERVKVILYTFVIVEIRSGNNYRKIEIKYKDK